MSSNKYTKEYKVTNGTLVHTVEMLHATEDDKNILKARVVTRRNWLGDHNVLLDSCSTIYTLKNGQVEALRTYMTPGEEDRNIIRFNLVGYTEMDIVRVYNRPIWNAQDRALTSAFEADFRSPTNQRLHDLKEMEVINLKLDLG